MWPNSQFLADLVTFTEEMLNRKLQVLYNGMSSRSLSVESNQVHYERIRHHVLFQHCERLIKIWPETIYAKENCT